ncbi:group II intron reverse transcriptase/maturase [Candidatus Methylospira mobilis]|uniref:group II intron reverse transcriptase/maturase n=1 Tax=Candidatus Methylospira mobilis TaxID=1808979 RepID=UPI0028F09034|nr:group II intron reverse transcriptase/maturase [Candidatus Methylospira mobilis]WNV03666.1 group II intron reverse transcriptase/maturase [Candidatus Methylospira mobilis]WNV03668.1 group II intron reverse transcriptase/maturase [Candidatus Methylospira mobilis]WNV05029.1 group II intron reverse transcriptase/maturase [Candidatus Methylospira mobilis]
MNDEGIEMKNNGIASDNRPEPGAAQPCDEPGVGESELSESANPVGLLERVLARDNLQRALKRVRQNKGAPGIDGMTVEELPVYLKQHWLEIRAQLVAGVYRPKPVLRVEIPKADGKTRPLGIPTAVDRFIQQAIAQVVSAQWEPHFHRHSYGFRPERSAHQAVRGIQKQVRDSYRWVVDMDLEAFFDRVNHDRLMNRLQRHVPDRALLRLINTYLKAGVRIDTLTVPTTQGVPQGGPLSPVLANVVLDELDWELERRGHRFARYADDCNIVVKSRRAGERLMLSLTHWIDKTLRLTVNERKSAVDRPWNRKFLGFTLSRGDARLKVSEPSLAKLKNRIRDLTRRTRGRRLIDIIAELRTALLGWKAYFGIAEVLSPLREIDKWIRRRLRCYQWKQWGSAGYRELRKRGVTVREAWNTSKSAHGPWRLSKTPALNLALPAKTFSNMGLPSLCVTR